MPVKYLFATFSCGGSQMPELYSKITSLICPPLSNLLLKAHLQKCKNFRSEG